MSEITKLYITAYIENIVIIICYTILAVIFHHWWIILISALFLNIPKKQEVKDE